MTLFKKKSLTSALCALASLSLSATDYYVSTSGDNANSGSQSEPFATISKAVSVMNDGDHCYVNGGTYRETVDFAGKTGLTIKAVTGQQVTVSGLDPVSGSWTNESGNLWYTTVNGMLTRNITINSSIAGRSKTSKTFESQVYKDDAVQFLARWPNKVSTAYDQLMEKDWYVMTQTDCPASSPEKFVVSGFPAEWDGADFSGAYLWANVQNEWSSWMVPVDNYDSAGKALNLSTYYSDENTVHTWIQTKHNPNIKDARQDAAKKYYGHIIVLGAKALLDSENEFFTDFTNNRLYVYSTDPTQNSYEIKVRSYAFLLPASASNITIEDIDIKAATMQVEGQDCVIKRSTLDFPSYGYAPYMNNMSASVPGLQNLKVAGSRTVFRDSTIENCFGGAFEVNGSDNYIHNCVAQNVNTMASWHSGFIVSGLRNTVSHSTVSKVGRSGFSITGGRDCRVVYNNVSDVGYLTDDLGGLHSSRDAQNTEIAYNWFHDIQSGHAIYMDNYNSHYIVHHNVIWNAYGHGVNHNRPSNHSFIINNTVFENWNGSTKADWTAIIGQRFGPWSDVRSTGEYGQQADSSYGSMWFNNLARHGINNKTNHPYYGFQISNNTAMSGDKLNSQAFDPAVHKLPEAEDTGIYIKGITSEFVTDAKPDQGAYEISNSSPDALWTAGHDFNNPPALPPFQESKLIYRNRMTNGTFHYADNNTLPSEWTTSSNAGDSILAKEYAGYNDPPANKRNSVVGKSLTVLSSSADLTYAETTIDGLEGEKYYNFSAYVRLFPYGDAASGVNDVTLYVKDSKGVQLGTTTVKTFPNYALDNRSTNQEWFMTEVSFALPKGEVEATIGFSTTDTGTFFVDNIGLARKFSLAPVVDPSAIPVKAAVNNATLFSVTATDADSSVSGYKWVIDGTAYEGASVSHTFTALKSAAAVSVTAVDQYGVESMPVSRTVEVVAEIDPVLSCSNVILDTQNINTDPVVIQPSIHVDVDYVGSAYNKLALYISESTPVSLSTPVFEKQSITSYSSAHKLFIPSDSVKDGVEYNYVVVISGSGKTDIQSTGTFKLDRMNMVPFTDSRALTHLAASDRRLPAGTVSSWKNLLTRSAGYDAAVLGTAPVAKGDAAYTVKGMKSVLFNNNGMTVSTPTDTGITAFVVARRQQTEVDLGGDKHQRIVSVHGVKNDYTAGSGGWTFIERNGDGTMNVFGPKLLTKSAADLKQGALVLGRYANKNSNRYIGEIFEVLLFDTVISAEETAVISQWLNDKWTGASFPQPTLDWDGDGKSNADEITGGTDPSMEEVVYPEMKTEWLAPIQNKNKKKLWWSIRVEQGVKHYLIQIDGQDIIEPASKPDGGLYEIDLPVQKVVSNFYAVGYDGTQLRVGVWQQDSGAAAPTDPLSNIDENLPSVLMIGDSISIGYDDEVRAAMSGKANIIHNPGNGADTRYGLNKIDEWLYREWDVIHFNWGLHDLKRLDGSNVGVTIPDYESNLTAIIGRMRALNPNAKLIFATTTPYPDGVSPVRYQSDAVAYNNAAKAIMNTNGIVINDLHALMMTKLDTNGDGTVTNAEDTQKLQINTNVHFTDAGSQVLANEVVTYLNSALSALPEAPVAQTSDPSAVTDTTAKLNGVLTKYGNTKTDLWVYWGDNDGAAVKGDWDHAVQLADDVESAGNYSHDLTGLAKGTNYYYRFYAENSEGSSWGSTVAFATGVKSVTLSIDTDVHITQAPGNTVGGLTLLIAGDRHTNGDCRIFMKFDTSSLPSNYSVNKATLRLYHVTGLDDDNEDAYVHSIQSDWTADNVVYGQAVSTERSHVVGADSYNQYVEVDVTSLMKLSKPHYGFSIRGPESGSKTGSYFHSSEGTNKPELIIEYSELLTPARGVSVVQDGKQVQWSVQEEYDVKEYRLVDLNGRIIQVIAADGSGSYSIILDELVDVQLVVVDHSGSSQIFYVEDGRIVTVNYTLEKGWNLIAVPGNGADMSEVKAVAVGALWRWDGYKYVETDAQKAYEGVWVYTTKAASVNVSAMKGEGTIMLMPGWTMAGPGNNVAVPDNVGAVFSYKQKYESILDKYDLLYQGVGYWFFVTRETTLKVDVVDE